MSQVVKEKSLYSDFFLKQNESAESDAPGWLVSLRERAFERFEQRGFPTTDEEDWKYTNVSTLARAGFPPATTTDTETVDRRIVESFVNKESLESRLIFIDGFLQTSLSSFEGVAENVTISDLLTASRGEFAEKIREKLSDDDNSGKDSFHDLSTAFLASGAFIHIGANVRVESPIQLLFLSTAKEHAAFPRVLVIAEANSSLTLIESYAALGEGDYFTNAVVETYLGEGARLNHYKVQTEGEGAYHVSSTKARIARGGSYDLTSINLGARLSRHNIEVSMSEEGGECWVDGLYLLGDGQHHDTHSLIDHLVPRCQSHQNYKGILDGRSRAVFNGRVFVHPDAQQTDAFQSNKNLLLSPDARVDTKPQLEIFADDVKCAHGATVGQLEEEELFYLVSRGLSPQIARNLLTYGFAEEIVGKIKVDSIRKQLDEAILNRLHADFGA